MANTVTTNGIYYLSSFDPATGNYNCAFYVDVAVIYGDDETDTNLLDGSSGDGIETAGEWMSSGNPITGTPAGQIQYTGYMIGNGFVYFNGDNYFLATNDMTLAGTSGTAIAGNYVYPCFLPGTLFATSDGLKPIEELQIGDLLKTAEGYAPPKWLARRDVHWNMTIPRRAAPILVKAGALDDGLPQRDLYISPAHALLIDGVLVNAELLINGHSIVQLLDYNRDFSYYNIELENHAVVYAEGAAVESYLEVGDNRSCYINAAEFRALYPHHTPVEPLQLPRVALKRQLSKRITEKLEQVAQQLGLAQSRVA